MTTYIPPRKNTAFVFYVSLVSRASRPQFQANPTLAAGDVLIAKDDGAPANLATLPVIDADFTKRVKVSLSAAEMNADNISILFSDVAGAEWDDLMILLQTSSQQINDLASQAAVDALQTTVGNIQTAVNTIQTQTGDVPAAEIGWAER